jgi:hypothetical protein
MKILTQDEVIEIEKLAASEIENIHKAFQLSEALGLLMLSNAITSFEETFVKKKYGNVVLSMCSEYRHLIISLIELVDDKYKGIVIKEIIHPQLKKVTDKEVFELLKKIEKKEI